LLARHFADFSFVACNFGNRQQKSASPLQGLMLLVSTQGFGRFAALRFAAFTLGFAVMRFQRLA
jgi:hypothetical protein